MHCLRIILGICIWDLQHNTTIHKLAHQQRLSSLLSAHHLCFLGHISRMPDSRLPKQLLVCAPIGGSRSVGGQKCHWNDLVQRDLVKCDFEDWRELAQDRLAWHGMVKISVKDLNREAEKKDDKKKDEKKRNQQVQLTIPSASQLCDHPNCRFVAVNQSGLVNHKRQKHTTLFLSKCKHCGKSFHSQGLANHERCCDKSL